MKSVIILCVGLILLCFISVIIFSLPAVSSYFNLTEKGNIGSAIAGMTGPALGIATSVLLYRALIKQTESNEDQKLRNESDFIFTFLGQLREEINSFYTKHTSSSTKKVGNEIITTKEEKRYYGIEALNDFSTPFRYEWELHNFKHTFKDHYEANLIRLIIRSYTLVERRIEESMLSIDLKKMFRNKLQSLFDCVLYEPLNNIHEAIKSNPHLADEISEEIDVFVKDKKKHANIASIDYTNMY